LDPFWVTQGTWGRVNGLLVQVQLNFENENKMIAEMKYEEG
jgi:hypothetical protein